MCQIGSWAYWFWAQKTDLESGRSIWESLTSNIIIFIYKTGINNACYDKGLLRETNGMMYTKYQRDTWSLVSAWQMFDIIHYDFKFSFEETDAQIQKLAHMSGKQWSQDLNPGLLVLQTVLLILYQKKFYHNSPCKRISRCFVLKGF